MSLAVTLHIYSGRHNPVWMLTPEQVREFSDRIRSLRGRASVKARASEGRLGYRGFSISSISTSTPLVSGGQKILVNDGIVDPGLLGLSLFDQDRGLEAWLLSTADGQINKDTRDEVERELGGSAREIINARFTRHMEDDLQIEECVPNAADAPPYQSELWSDICTQIYNNCYNYANDQPTNTFAQPGAAHGVNIGDYFSCGEVEGAALRDGLSLVDNFDAPLGSGGGWYVALVIRWDRKDYHWYRQDADGCWSHKVGGFEVTRKDHAGNFIANPVSCNRGPYTKFCSFMVTKRNVRIR